MGEVALSCLEKLMPRRPQYRALAGIDRKALEAFQAGIRKRYSDEQILAELAACAKRLGRSPTMREFAADPETSVHPQTVIEHFGSWNEAKRKAGLVPRRFATREELLDLLRQLGAELGRIPTARELGRLPKFADWAEARKTDETMLTEWQIYRMFEARKGAWSTFQFLVRERLLAAGGSVGGDGSVG